MSFVELDNDTLKKLHAVMVELMDEFVRICEERNFTYFLYAGTLLGAIRHKGFIPWDDDVDIAMPRGDYEKFLDYYENIQESNYYVLSNRRPVNTHYHYNSFAKLCKKNTLFAEQKREEKDYCGIYIDIWPYDNCNLLFLPLQSLIIYFLLKSYKIKTYQYTPGKKINRIIYKLLRPFIPSFIINKYQRLLNISYTFFDKYVTRYFSIFSGFNGFIKETHKYSTVFPLSKILFEGKYYNAPIDADLFLRKMYGNYMKIPKEADRRNHNTYIVFDTSKESGIE